MRIASPLAGLLRAYGDDLYRLQRLLDPLLVTGLFSLLALPRTSPSSTSEHLAALLLVGL